MYHVLIVNKEESMDAKISARIIAEVGKGKTLEEAMDTVLFKGAYELLVEELYKELQLLPAVLTKLKQAETEMSNEL
jgi:hypothetical protein